MRCLFCTYDGPGWHGGPFSWLRRFVPQLESLGHEVSLVMFCAGDEKRCEGLGYFASKGVRVHKGRFGDLTDDKVRLILRAAKEEKADVVVANMVPAGFFARRWLREARVPIVGVMHSDDDFHWGLTEEFGASGEWSADGWVCVSALLGEKLSRLSGIGRVAVIPYGVLVSEGAARGAPCDRVRLVYAGRLEEEQKRIVETARAMCSAVATISNAEARIYGDGSASGRVAEIIRASDVGDRVRLCGAVPTEQLQQEFMDADIFVLLSDYEGMPIALMEAMACGLVPICTQVASGIPELVEDGVTGFLVADRRDGFLKTVRQLCQNHEVRRRVGAAARAKIVRGFSNENCASRWSEFLSGFGGARAWDSIVIPETIELPRVHPALAREDYRRETQVDRWRRRLRCGAWRYWRTLRCAVSRG